MLRSEPGNRPSTIDGIIVFSNESSAEANWFMNVDVNYNRFFEQANSVNVESASDSASSRHGQFLWDCLRQSTMNCEEKERIRSEIVAFAGVITEPWAIALLIAAFEDECDHVRRVAARSLAKHGPQGLASLLKSIAFEKHSATFFEAAHLSLYLLQFQAPMRDRNTIVTLLETIVGPEPERLAPPVALEAVHP